MNSFFMAINDAGRNLFIRGYFLPEVKVGDDPDAAKPLGAPARDPVHFDQAVSGWARELVWYQNF